MSYPLFSRFDMSASLRNIHKRGIKILWVLCAVFMLSGCSDDDGGSGNPPPPLPPAGSCYADSYVRYGDYLSAQMVSNRTFGHGMFVCEFQAADGPTCSTFWLYANEPSVRNLPDVAQNWRWNEIDFEFVPYTEATQSQYYLFDGGLPTPVVHAFGTELNFGDPRSNDLDNKDPVTWKEKKIQTDETIARDMWLFYNTWMETRNGGPPTGGYFTLTDDGTKAQTSHLAYNVSADDLKSALDALNGGLGLFDMKGKYTVSSAAAGATGDIVEGSLNVIRNLKPCDVIGQLSPGEEVKSVEDSSIIPAGTTILSKDQAACTVTLSQKATKAVTGQTFQFVPVGSWAIAFTETPHLSDTLVIDASNLEPGGSLGKVVIGWKDAEHSAFNALNLSIFQPFMTLLAAGETWWDLLRDQTGEGKIWKNAKDWKYPLSHIHTPDSCDMKDMVTLNFWRSPKGNESAEIDFGGWGKVDHTGILREKPIPGTVGHDSSFTSAVLNNEAYVFDSTGKYKPTQSVHTYTIVWTPTRMAQYIDAPQRGQDISNATPIAEYRLADFPSLDHSGPQAEGAHIPWIGTELNQPIGNVTINVANYVAFRAASTGTNNYAWATGDLSAQSEIIQNVAFLEGTSTALKNSLPGKGVTEKDTKAKNIPPGTTIVSVDEANKTITLSAKALGAASAACLIMGQDVLKGTITKDNAIISELDLKKDEKVADRVSVGQMIIGDGIADGTTVKDIDEVKKTVIMNLGAAKTQTTNLIFQTAPSGAGWSGPPPAADFAGADAYVRSVGFFPLKDQAKDGTSTADFVTDIKDPNVFWLDFSDGTWTEDNFNPRITKYFGILYAQDYTSEDAIPGKSPLRDAKSPLSVAYETVDGQGAMRLRCSLSQDPTKAKRNFFVLQPKQVKDAEISADNPLVRAEITSKDKPGEYYAVSSSVTTPSAFYAPPKGESVTVTVNVWVSSKGYYDPKGGQPDTPDPNCEAEITLKTAQDGSVSWEVIKDDHHVIETFQSANPHLITVKAGS